jgi:ribosomal protein L36
MMKCNTTVLELPIVPEEGQDDEEGRSITIHSYVDELSKISIPEDLKIFTKKWRPVWLLAISGRVLNEEEIKIVEGTYDAAEALVCMHDNQNEGACVHISAGKGCPGVHIMLPLTFMQITLLADKYQVPETMIFQKLCGVHSSDPKVLRRMKALKRLERMRVICGQLPRS